MSQNMLRPDDIAVILQTTINDKAVQKFNAAEVTDKIYCNVTADYQKYERLQKGEYEVGDNQRITPVIISRVEHYEYPADYLRYEETYEIKVYGYASDLISLEKIFKEITVEENTTNKSVVISPFRVTKEMEDISFGIELEAMDGTLDKRIEGTGSFTWTFLDGVMTSYDTIITIDGEEMPYINFSFTDNVFSTQSQTIDATGQTKNINSNSFYEMFLHLPYISTSPVIKSLYKEFYDGSYNKKHVLTYYDSALDEVFTFDVIMNSKEFIDPQPKVLDFAISLRRAKKTVTVTIDGIEVPVLSFNINSSAELDTNTKINQSSATSAHLSDSYQLTLDIAISDMTNTKVDELFQKVMDFDFGTPHTITFTNGSITGNYDSLLRTGSYSWEEEPDDRISLIFVEQDGTI